jgi:hypothetical protein
VVLLNHGEPLQDVHQPPAGAAGRNVYPHSPIWHAGQEQLSVKAETWARQVLTPWQQAELTQNRHALSRCARRRGGAERALRGSHHHHLNGCSRGSDRSPANGTRGFVERCRRLAAVEQGATALSTSIAGRRYRSRPDRACEDKADLRVRAGRTGLASVPSGRSDVRTTGSQFSRGFRAANAAVGDVASQRRRPELRSGGATVAAGVSGTTGCKSPAPLRFWSAQRRSGPYASG